MLADLYNDSKSSVYAPTQALKWYERVATETSASNPRAMLELAKLHRAGHGETFGNLEAKQWILRLQNTVSEKDHLYKQATKLLQKIDLEFI